MLGQEYEHLQWIMGYKARHEGIVPRTWVANYSLVDLIEKGLIAPNDGNAFLEATGLKDFFWQITWPEDYETPDEFLVNTIGQARGYVIFVHGWTGNHLIWEDLPGMTVLSNRQLVAFAVDHNGFGESRFINTSPHIDKCNPPAAMETLQRWIDLIKIRRQPGQIGQRVIHLVGHSMGGATLFYLNPILWNYGEVTRYALAPALLLEDEMHQVFYTTLGIGIGILQRIPALEIFERFLKPGMLNTLLSGASDYVKDLHSAQYNETPRGVTGATFLAMGRLQNREIAHDWELMQVMLGHRDPLVGLTDMMDLLMKMEFPAANIRVVPGTHYMFSVGHESPANAWQHAQNRELVVQDILTLHQKACMMQEKGRLIG